MNLRFRNLKSLIFVLVALLAPLTAKASTIVNGGFETPAEPSTKYLQVFPGSEPSGFGWSVVSGNVEINGQGYIGGAGTFSGPAASGSQWLDLDGYSASGQAAGTIRQDFATTLGTAYLLSLDYANNPFIHFAGIPSANVIVRDTLTGIDLFTVAISHGTATASDYDWTNFTPIQFIATGTTTSLIFASTDPASSDSGIFLDSISVEAVPEPGTTFSLLLPGAVFLLGFVHWKRRSQSRIGMALSHLE